MVDTVDGANAPELVTKVGSHAKTAAAPVAPAVKPPSVTQRIQTLLKSAPVLLFMKGDPDAPRCGFSSKVPPHPLAVREQVAVCVRLLSRAGGGASFTRFYSQARLPPGFGLSLR